MKRIAVLATAMVAGIGLVAQTSGAQDNRWTRLESSHFIVYSNAAGDRARDFVDRLEAFDSEADKFYRQIGDSELPDNGKQVFYYLSKVGDYELVRPGSVAGTRFTFEPFTSCPFEDSRYFGISMGENRQAQNGEYLNLDLSYTYFAYARTKNIKFFSAPLPKWLDSGLKYYLMTMNIQPDKLVVGQMLPEMAVDLNPESKRFPPLSTVVSGTFPPSSGVTKLNAESWFLTHWMASTPDRRKMLAAYIARTRDGEDPLKAFSEAAGTSPDDLMPVFQDYLAKGVPVQVYKRTATSPDAISVRVLPDYGAPVPLIDAAVSACATLIHRQTLLGELRALAKANPGDPFVQRTLLRAEVLTGDLKNGEAQAAEAPLEVLVSAHPDDVDAATLLGHLHLRLAESDAADVAHDEYAAARAALAKAYRLAPASPTILALFSRARADLPGYPDDQAVQAMNLAQSYSDGVYTAYVVELDVRRGDYDGALKWLADIHPEQIGGESGLRAKALIDALKAAKPQAEVLPMVTALQQLRFRA